MGVHATYCLLCGLPIQHDHYVATDRQNVWEIYRVDNRPEGHFPFTPEHDWLLRGVAFNTEEGPFFGHCSDGGLETEDGQEYYVGRDSEDYTAMHVFCWEAAGKPRDDNDLCQYKYAYDKTFLSKYQEQLFDFAKCVANGDDWLLIDPTLPAGARNRARIEAVLKIKPRQLNAEGTAVVNPRNVAELLASDDWLLEYRHYDETNYDVWRFRNNVTPEIDTTGYPHMFWLIISPGETPPAEMERFERDLFNQAQADGLAVALAMITVQRTHYFVLQTKEPQALQALLATLRPPGKLELQCEDDPEWTGYFEEFYSRIVQLRGY